jgi:hypothetical protein
MMYSFKQLVPFKYKVRVDIGKEIQGLRVLKVTSYE